MCHLRVCCCHHFRLGKLIQLHAFAFQRRSGSSWKIFESIKGYSLFICTAYVCLFQRNYWFVACGIVIIVVKLKTCTRSRKDDEARGSTTVDAMRCDVHVRIVFLDTIGCESAQSADPASHGAMIKTIRLSILFIQWRNFQFSRCGDVWICFQILNASCW